MGRYCFNTFFYVLFHLSFFPFVLSQLSSTQKNTMVRLYELLNGSVPWNITQNPDPCSWHGIKCDSTNSSITDVSLSRFSLTSSQFLPVLCLIDSLQNLDLSNNQLSSIPNGFFTDCGKINGLKLLNFSKNRLVGSLPAFNGFLDLQFLDMSYNLLGGEIGLQLHGLVSLKSLNLSNNHFNGFVPTNLGKAKLLEQLVLSTNSFQEKIPDEILGYRNFSFIDLSQNRLRGAIPDGIGELSRLKVLILSSNQLSGEIPTTLSNITTLSRFAAYQNGFSGAIPSGITKYLRNLDLSYNKLVGLIPKDLLSSPNLQTVDLSGNLLNGSIPSNISSSLIRLRLGSNFLSGEIMSESLAILQNLMYIELENNSLTGVIPAGLGSCQRLALLNMGQNELTGSLPAELGNLINLQVLKLDINKLVGQIPIQLTQLRSLSILNLSSNSLDGPIPAAISNLKNLTNLILQGNNLNGSIPASIGSMTSLMELQLGKNQLGSKIPTMPRNLQIALNLSNNLFKGLIPTNLVSLSNLEVLDLSNNQFSGEIPEFLTKMGTLTQLLLSNNQLSGVVPKFNPLVKVDTGGNEGLIYHNPDDDPSAGPAKQRKSVALAVILAIAAAVITVGIITILAISISRRYYRVNDEQLQPAENPAFPQVIQGNLITTNGIHRSNIDFSKAMEDVALTSNVVLKTKFSTYYKATMPSGTSYFVKKLNLSDKVFAIGNHDKFDKEMEFLGKLSNSNVMTPLAYVLTLDGAYIFYEFAPEGTLFDFLHGSLKNDLDWASRYSIAIGVAQGLAFLHSCTSHPILLLDLSSKSIMLKSLKEPLVGDIETYKVIDPSKSTGSFSMVAGSVGYVPPEYAYTMRVTIAGNVYSFGVVLLELLTGKPVVTEGTELVKFVVWNSAQQDRVLDSSISKTSPAVRSQMLAILKVALDCVSASPEARPKMKTVLRMLLNAR